MKCPECGKRMIDHGYTGMMYIECRCGHKEKMSFDNWLLTEDGKRFLEWSKKIKREIKTAQNAEIPPKSDNVTPKS